jgi:hypothetical protein
MLIGVHSVWAVGSSAFDVFSSCGAFLEWKLGYRGLCRRICNWYQGKDFVDEWLRCRPVKRSFLQGYGFNSHHIMVFDSSSG